MRPLARRYGFHGLSLRDSLLMKSMIERAAHRMEREWIPGDTAHADCIFYQGSRPSDMRSDAECVHVGANCADSASRSMHYPPRLSDLVSALVAVDQKLGNAGRPQPQPSSSWQQLLTKLQCLIASADAFSLVDNSGSGWTLYPEQRQFAACGPIERLPRDLPDSVASQWHVSDKALLSTNPRQPLENLLWFFGIASGPEGLLSPIGSTQALRMRVWPHLMARAPRSFSGLAAQLRQESRSPLELQANANVPMEEVAAFVNACALCSFLTLVEVSHEQGAELQREKSPPPPARSAQRVTRFLGAIRVALGMPA